jgi:hypothetical protein
MMNVADVGLRWHGHASDKVGPGDVEPAVPRDRVDRFTGQLLRRLPAGAASPDWAGWRFRSIPAEPGPQAASLRGCQLRRGRRP